MGLAGGRNQLDNLLSVLRRVLRWMRSRQPGLLLHKHSGIHATGSTPVTRQRQDRQACLNQEACWRRERREVSQVPGQSPQQAEPGFPLLVSQPPIVNWTGPPVHLRAVRLSNPCVAPDHSQIGMPKKGL